MATRASTSSLLGDGTAMSDSVVALHEGAIVSPTSSVEYSLVQGTLLPGPGNLDIDPQLYGPLAGDARLGPNSPCIDAGFTLGDALHAQCIMRDPFNPNGLGVALSNAVQVLIVD